MEQVEVNGLLAKAVEQARQEEHEAIADLQAIALEVGPERLFTITLVMLSMAPPGRAKESTHGSSSVKTELLAYHLYPLFGSPPKGRLDPQVVDRAFTLVDTILRSYSLQDEGTIDRKMTLDLQAVLSCLLTDTRIVRGSAYPEQTMLEISEVQGHFEDWFARRTGIGPRRAIEVLRAVLQSEEDRANEWFAKLREGTVRKQTEWNAAKRARKGDLTAEQQALLSRAHTSQEAAVLGYAEALAAVPPDEVPVPRESIRLSPVPTMEEWHGLISLIGCTTETKSAMQHPVEMQKRPLYVLPLNHVLLSDISNAMDQLWHAFEKAARHEHSFYSGSYQQRRGRWLEERIATLLQRVFPPETIYKNLTYPDPDQGSGGQAQLDIAIHWPPFLVLIEAKAAQFRFASQLGDVGRLRSDLKANVADAFDQARRASRFIQSAPEAVFREVGTGRTLAIRHDQIQRIYLMTASLHHLASIATQLASVQGLGLFGDGEYPWALSVADLDLVSEFCPGPDVFLHYAERRLVVQKETVRILGDEIELFGAYLKTRLQANRVWEQPGMKRPDWVHLSGFQEPFDAVMAHRRGTGAEPPSIRLEVPQVVGEILQEFRRHKNDKDARWIAFCLLSLSDRMLMVVEKMFIDLRAQRLNADSFRRATHSEDDIAISIVATKDQPREALVRNLQQRTLLEKYRRKCTKSIGFGIVLSDTSKPFECAVWAEWPWIPDLDMDQLIASEPPPTPAVGSKIPGRNDPCLCGSKTKFKKCCLPKMETLRRC